MSVYCIFSAAPRVEYQICLFRTFEVCVLRVVLLGLADTACRATTMDSLCSFGRSSRASLQFFGCDFARFVRFVHFARGVKLVLDVSKCVGLVA